MLSGIPTTRNRNLFDFWRFCHISFRARRLPAAIAWPVTRLTEHANSAICGCWKSIIKSFRWAALLMSRKDTTQRFRKKRTISCCLGAFSDKVSKFSSKNYTSLLALGCFGFTPVVKTAWLEGDVGSWLVCNGGCGIEKYVEITIVWAGCTSEFKLILFQIHSFSSATKTTAQHWDNSLHIFHHCTTKSLFFFVRDTIDASVNEFVKARVSMLLDYARILNFSRWFVRW